MVQIVELTDSLINHTTILILCKFYTGGFIDNILSVQGNVVINVV